MKKRNFGSIFGRRRPSMSKASEEEAVVAIPGVAKLLKEDEVPAVVDPVEAKEEEEDDEEWGEDPDEESTKRSGYIGNYRDLPRGCDSYSVTSSTPTDASSKALRHGKTFDYSDAGSFSLASRRSTDLYDSNDAESILVKGIPPSLLCPSRSNKTGDDNYSVANSSVTTRGSASLLFQTATFDLSGTSMFGAPRGSETGSEDQGESFEENGDLKKDSTDASSVNGAGMAHAFSQDVHSFLGRVFSNKIVEGEEE